VTSGTADDNNVPALCSNKRTMMEDGRAADFKWMGSGSIAK